MKVRYESLGILKNENGELFLCDATGYGDVMSLETVALYVITHRNESGYPIEIKEL